MSMNVVASVFTKWLKRWCQTASVLLLSLFSSLALAVPTVDGWVFGTDAQDADGIPDINEYVLLQLDTSGGSRGKLYYFIDGNTAYFALVVSKTVNDNVCSIPSNGADGQFDQNYQRTACWNNGKQLGVLNGNDYNAMCAGFTGTSHNCEKLISSDHAEFILECGARSGDDYTFWIDLADAADLNAPRGGTGGWTGDALGADALGTILPLAPGFTAATSTAKNLNATTWDVTLGGARTGNVNWKSPDDGTPFQPTLGPPYIGDINDGATPPPGTDSYDINDTDSIAANFNNIYNWEWPLVYEFSLDLSDCNGPFEVNPGTSHNSPAKSGAEDVTFNGGPLIDFGDAPDSYGTDTADGGNAPSHQVLFGSLLQMGASVDAEIDGQPSNDATGDGSDEAGVASFPPVNVSPGSSYTVTVNVTNTTSGGAELCGWIDFDLDGSADDGTFENDERACITVNASNCSDNGGGNFACDLVFTVPADYVEVLDEPTYARFRLGSVLAQVQSPTGAADDGEVEDYIVPANTLPVSLHYFKSRDTGPWVLVEWTTASEAFNVGFHIWGKVGDDWLQLSEQPILSEVTDAVTPQEYRAKLTVADEDRDRLEGLALSTIDTSGNEEMYGLFELGKAYGQKALPAAIPWDAVRAEYEARMQAKGYTRRGDHWRRGGPKPAMSQYPAFEIEVIEPGMHRVTYEQLLAAGLDLKGVANELIAVTLKKEGKPRRIHSRGPWFGRGSYIDFWGEAPDYPDALYVENYIYRIEVDHSRAMDAATFAGDQDMHAADYLLERVVVNEDNAYMFVNVMDDPWYAALLRYPWGPLSYTTTFELPPTLVADRPGHVSVTVAGTTVLPAEPDHHVRLMVNDRLVADIKFDGQQAVTMEGAVPAGTLRAGANQVSVVMGGDTLAPFDLVFVNDVTLSYPRMPVADGDALLVESIPGEPEALHVTGFGSRETIGYAYDDQSNLTRLVVDWQRNEATGRFDVTVPTILGAAGRRVSYWISTETALEAPKLLGPALSQDLLTDAADYLVIAHPAFVPESGDTDHPLSRYVRHRESQGWSVRVVALDAIQSNYGGGMPLPGAVTNFLRAADAEFDYEHVLLVGDDSYDYLDKLGNGSISFLPTLYTRTELIAHSPSDGLLADLDGDQIADKAVGRWPVRALADLEVMVDKTLAWENPVDGLQYQRSALWVVDSEDPDVPSFADQAERMIAELVTMGAGGTETPWPADQVDRIYFDEVVASSDQSVADAAREQLIAAIEQGKSLTGFIGHGSPTTWTFQGLLRPQHVSEIDNVGKPTMIGTLACYTSYFVSPNTDTLAHRLMKGYKLDASGNVVPGFANGAVAIHGAATLSGYRDNEVMVREILNAQLRSSATLGAAIAGARRQAARLGLIDVAVNWALLGDPTLRIGQ